MAIPVALSKMFRHSCIYVRTDAGIKAPADLKGKRVGTTQLGSTGLVFMKGMLQHDYGVEQKDIHWFIGGLDGPAQRPLVPLDLPPDWMVLAAELDPERHHDAGHVSSAEDCVTPGKGDQRRDGIGLFGYLRINLPYPRLLDPLDHRQGQICLVLELVIERPPRVARLARHLFQHDVSVAVSREAPRRRLKQRSP